MKDPLDTLWNEYFAEECAMIDTEKERSLVKKASALQKKLGELLSQEQSAAVEKYVEALYELNSVYTKKAFYKGCSFALSFLLEAGEI